MTDEEGVVGFGTFFLTVESTLLGITTGLEVAFDGLPLFRSEGGGADLDRTVGAFVGAFFGGRPRFLPVEGVVAEALVVDLDCLLRFCCSIISTEFAAAFGVRTRFRGDNEESGVDSVSILNFEGRPLLLFSGTSESVALLPAATGFLVVGVVDEDRLFLFEEPRLEWSASLSTSTVLACVLANDARRVDNSFGVVVAFILVQEGQNHF